MRKFTISEANLKHLYYEKELSTSKIGKLYNCHSFSVTQRLRKYGLPARPAKRYKVNHDYFDAIDTERKAYFLWLLIADGYIHKKSHLIQISLIESDSEVLRQLAKDIYPDNDFKLKVYHYNKTMTIKGRTSPKKPSARFEAHSKHIVEKLNSYGIAQGKSFSVRWPQTEISDLLLPHFVRGLIDGDGCLSKFKKSDSFCVHFIGSVALTQELHSKLLSLGFGFKAKKESKYSQPMITLWLHGVRKCEKFLDWMYKDATIYLERKHQKYIELKESILKKDLKLNRKGFIFNKKNKTNPYQVTIRKNKKTLFCQNVNTPERAHEIYVQKRKELLALGKL